MKLIPTFDRRLLPVWILAFAICLLTLPQTASAQEQRVKFTSSSMTVKDAIDQIEKQTGLKFGLSEPFNISRTINFGTTELPLKQTLTLISEPDHSFSFYQNYILIQQKAPAPVERVTAQAPSTAVASAPVEPKAEPEITDNRPMTYFYYDNTQDDPEDATLTNYNYVPTAHLYNGYTPKVAVKTNFLWWATTTPNVSLEFALARKWTFEPTLAYNPWRFDSEKSLRFWMVQPELRYWFCNAFENHFIGIHGIYGEYNVGNVDLPFTDALVDTKYKGKAYGGGIAYGYHMPVGKRWGLEFTLGVGYLKFDYDKYNCSSCDEYIGSYKKDYFGVTKAGVSMVFMLK